MSPGVLLAGLVVLASAQLTHLVRRGRGLYPVTLVLSVLGVLGGELLASGGHLRRPALGVLHPLADLVVILALQAAAALLSAPRPR